jgi:4-hydroxybenzoate polyprenyltransferase
MNADTERSSPLRDFFELVRLPNLFTAMADVTMGFLFVQTPEAFDDAWHLDAAHAGTLLLLVAASTLLYAGGVVLNDVCDVDLDRNERPDRPIPSGRILLRTATGLAGLLLGLGVLLTWLVPLCGGSAHGGVLEQCRPGLIGTLLAGCIVLYDTYLKRTWLGPVGMGACRSLNVLLGMSVLVGPFHAEHWLVAGAIGTYIMGLTWLARNEAEESDRRQLLAAALVMLAGIGLLAGLPQMSSRLLENKPEHWYLLMTLLGAMIGWRCVWAVIEPTPVRVQIAVANGIMSLVILDAAACLAARDIHWAVVILAFLLPAMFLGRFLKST